MLGAKTKLSQLVEAAERGEEVFIARNGVPVAKIVPMPRKQKKFALGFLRCTRKSGQFAVLPR